MGTGFAHDSHGKGAPQERDRLGNGRLDRETERQILHDQPGDNLGIGSGIKVKPI